MLTFANAGVTIFSMPYRSELGGSCAPRRLPSRAPRVSEVGNAALVEREAVTLPLDHAFGFELADVGPAAIEVLR